MATIGLTTETLVTERKTYSAPAYDTSIMLVIVEGNIATITVGGSSMSVNTNNLQGMSSLLATVAAQTPIVDAPAPTTTPVASDPTPTTATSTDPTATATA